jgi:excisionase family DNA binding protein
MGSQAQRSSDSCRPRAPSAQGRVIERIDAQSVLFPCHVPRPRNLGLRSGVESEGRLFENVTEARWHSCTSQRFRNGVVNRVVSGVATASPWRGMSTLPTPRQTYSVEEAAAILGISRSHAYACVKSGDLPSIRYRRRIVVPARALEAALEPG